MCKNDILDTFEKFTHFLKSVMDKFSELFGNLLETLKDFLGHYEEKFELETPKIIKSTKYYCQNVSIKYNYIPVFKRNLPYQRRSY